jgi:hypothetical protein
LPESLATIVSSPASKKRLLTGENYFFSEVQLSCILVYVNPALSAINAKSLVVKSVKSYEAQQRSFLEEKGQ